MDWNFLKIETSEEGICILTISHPQSLNALSRPVLEEMYRFVTDIPEGTAVLIIRGDGPKSFVAGADISQMAGFDAEQGLDFGRFGAEVFRRIEEPAMPSEEGASWPWPATSALPLKRPSSASRR